MGGKLSFDRSVRPRSVACISINEMDKLRVLHPTPGLVCSIRDAITGVWPCGIQEEHPLGDAHQFKLKGSPWHADGAGAVVSRLLVQAVLQAAARLGLELMVASDVSRAHSDASSFFFRAGPPPPFVESMVSLSTNDTDKLRLVGAPPELRDMLVGAVDGAIRAGWPPGVQSRTIYHGAVQWKLAGNPWYAQGEETVHMRRMVCRLLEGLEQVGYTFYISADVSEKQILGDSDTLIFRYQPEVLKARGLSEWCSISMNMHDRLRLIDLPAETLEHVTRRIQGTRAWPRGVSSVREYAGSREFKMNGNPWWATGDDAVYARAFVTAVLEAMGEDGWQVAATSALMRKDSDKSSWFFSRRRDEPIVPQSGMVCVSLNESDLIRVIGGDAASGAAAVTAVKAATAAWPKGVQAASTKGGAVQIKVRGMPWWSSGDEALYSRSMLCHVAQGLLDSGLRIIASADVSAKYVSGDNGDSDYPDDVHSWWVVKEHPQQGPARHVDPGDLSSVPSAPIPSASTEDVEYAPTCHV
eukprot:TRINITY_DN1709_c0_g1_i1.p1 TRINITY_DN1709_c0_g1~~TRINITY_DN1709_c0_g1_i1.p1  ORF type:complete len:526 (+),score=66.01 TRINITY_DN1709_c0_g1_i1:63-1640(+)